MASPCVDCGWNRRFWPISRYIDDLRPALLTHKYVDDTTVTETIEKGSVSEMQNAVDKLIEWSELNHMNINTKKTEEMVMDSYGKENTTLTITTDAVEQV